MAEHFGLPYDFSYPLSTYELRSVAPLIDDASSAPDHESAPEAGIATYPLDTIFEEPEASNEQDVDPQPAIKRPRLTYSCDRCGTSFSAARSLTRHRNNSKNCGRAERIVCGQPNCGKSFARRDLHGRHVREVHEQRRRNEPHDTALLDEALHREPEEARVVSLNHHMPMMVPGHEQVRVSVQSPVNDTAWSTAGKSESMMEQTSQPTDAGFREPARADPIPDPLSSTGSGSSTRSSNGTKGGSINATDTTSVNRMATIPFKDTDAMSLTSISTVSSEKSFSSLRLPFRTKPLPGMRTGADPRSRPMKNAKPCPLCNKDLGTLSEDDPEATDDLINRSQQVQHQPTVYNNGQIVKQHLENHLRHMLQEDTHPRCLVCQIRFVHQRDLDWHIQCSSTKASCGFDFKHDSPCQGHHPPRQSSEQQAQHDMFTAHLRTWEASQLAEYRRYINDYTFDEAAPNVPPYGSSDAYYRRSTGSLVTLRSRLSERSWLSTPIYINFTAKASSKLLRSVKSQQLVKGQKIGQKQLNSMLSDAISAGNLEQFQSLFSRGARIVSEQEHVAYASVAVRNGDPQMLELLFRAEELGRSESSATGSPPRVPSSPKRKWDLSEMISVWDLHRIAHDEDQTTMNNFTTCVKFLLDHGARPPDDEWLSHMVWENLRSVRHGVPGLNKLVPCIQCLIAHGASFDWACLPQIIEADWVEALEIFLVNRSATPEHGQEQFSRLFFDLVSSNNLQRVFATKELSTARYFLDQGAALDRTTIYTIAFRNLGALMETVLSHETSNAVSHDTLENALCIAASSHTFYTATTVVEALVKRNINLNARFSDCDPDWSPYQGWSPLCRAVHAGDAFTASRLLSYGADIDIKDVNDKVPLAIALADCRPHMHQILLGSGANTSRLDARYQATMTLAMASSEREVHKLIRSQSPDAYAALFLALARKCPRLVRLVVPHTGDVDRQNADGLSPLIYALEMGCEAAIVQTLISHGANVNRLDSSGRSPFEVSCVSNCGVQIVQILIDNGADLHRTNRRGRNAVHHAASTEAAEIVALLHEHGVDIDLPDEDGWTPLSLVFLCMRGEQIIETLLQCGAEIAANTKIWRAVVDEAITTSSWESVLRLVKYGLDVNSHAQLWGSNKSILHLALKDQAWTAAVGLLNCGAELHQADVPFLDSVVSKRSCPYEMPQKAFEALVVHYHKWKITNGNAKGRHAIFMG